MIRRGPRKERDFTVISNFVLRDGRLSFRARGLLAFLLSQPEHYRVSARELVATCPQGRERRDAIRTALAELEALHYLVRRCVRRPDGTFTQEAVVYEDPQPETAHPVLVPPAETPPVPPESPGTADPVPVQPFLKEEVPVLEETEGLKPSVEQKLDVGASTVRQVFEAWLSSTGRSGRTVLDDKRRRLIAKALDRYPLPDVLDAVRGWEHSAFHRGHNARGRPFNDLGLLLRDAEHIEQFRDAARGPREPDPGPGGRPRPAIDAVMKDQSKPSGRVIL